MASTGFIAISLMLVAYSSIGVVYLLRPQLMFRIYHFPTESSGDHLTEDGVRAYKRYGYGIIGTGIFLIVAFLYLFFVRY